MGAQGNPLLDSILNPPDPGLRLHNLALKGLIGRMENQQSQGYFAPPVSEDYISNELSKHISSLVSNTPTQELHKKASEVALKSYTQKNLGVGQGVQGGLELGTNILSSLIQPIDPSTGLPNAQLSVVSPAIKASRALQIARSAEEGRVPVSRFEGLRKALMDAISERNTVYHATDLEAVPKIAEAGAILPNPLLHSGLGKKAAKEAMAKQIAAGKAKKGDWIPADSITEQGFEQLTEDQQTNWKAITNAMVKEKLGSPYWHELDKKLTDLKKSTTKTLQVLHHPTEPYAAIEDPDNPGKWLLHSVDYPEAAFTHPDLVGKPQYTELEHFTGGTLKETQNAAKEMIASEHNPDAGVSFSRVPRIAPKAEKAISFELDASKIPPSRPFAESGYGKTRPVSDNSFEEDQSNLFYMLNTIGKGNKMPSETSINSLKNVSNAEKSKALDLIANDDKQGLLEWAAGQHNTLRYTPRPILNVPNKTFEFEGRTYNTPIDVKAIKRVLVDRSALNLHDPKDLTESQLWDIHSTPEEKQGFADLWQKAIDTSATGISSKEFLKDKVKFYTKVMEDIKTNRVEDPIEKVKGIIKQSFPGIPIEVHESGRAMHVARVSRYKNVMQDFLSGLQSK